MVTIKCNGFALFYAPYCYYPQKLPCTSYLSMRLDRLPYKLSDLCELGIKIFSEGSNKWRT